MEIQEVIGLFGTCGNSRWRDKFITKYNVLGIPWYNPQVAVGAWKPEMAAQESAHLDSDRILVVVINNETTALGSLAETGFCVIQVTKASQSTRYAVIYIDPTVAEGTDTPKAIADSIRARRLVLAHLRQLRDERVIICQSAEEVKTKSIALWHLVQEKRHLST